MPKRRLLGKKPRRRRSLPASSERKTKPQTDRQSPQARTRALHALAHMRREKVSLAEACRLEHIKPSTFLRYVGSAVRQDKPGGRYRATKGDRFRRDLQIATPFGPVTIPVYASKNAEKISKYLNAVAHYLRTGDQAKLRPFKGKTLKVGRQRIKLLTDPDTLSSLAEADVLHLDQLYASVARRS